MTHQEDVKAAVDTLRNGGVILCPTDTIAGLSCDALRPEAIQRIFEIKQRPPQKSVILLVSSITMLEGYVESIPEAAYQLLEVTEDPMTIIYPKAVNLPPEAYAPEGSVAIRLVKSGFIYDMVERFRRPVVSTSANISGQPAPRMTHEADPLISQAVDLVVDSAEARSKASSIIKFEADSSFRIIRK